MINVVVISALWCPSCLILKKNLKKLNDEYKDINIEVLDYDFDEDKVKNYNVGETLPVVIVLKDNKEENRLIGEKSYDELISFLKENNVL